MGEKKENQNHAWSRNTPLSDWRQLESWGREHQDHDVCRLANRAFDHHDLEAMNQLKLEYDWFLKRME